MVYKMLENKSTDIEEVKGNKEAKQIISKALKLYNSKIEPMVKAERKMRGY